MIIDCLFIGLGGAGGAIGRYLLGMVPLRPQNGLPVMTLLINIFGAFCIGYITALAIKSGHFNPRLVLFLKVGLCGGFTTFSSFSLETVGLLQAGDTFIAVTYAVLSVVLCLGGVLLGQLAVR